MSLYRRHNKVVCFDAYERGAVARRRGEARAENVYLEGCDEWHDWRLGWVDERDRSQGKPVWTEFGCRVKTAP